ncbi:uncharacterized protein LOC141637573 isoform X2 [Silene latifolia]|uniref:uncharacterized protein LOC141637573 isoform X2 n=1 Tax=Silene latifolia TaxID=37657 RepID=UPI003D779319
MKFSPSSSTSFSPNFCTNKGNGLSCFSGFLSRILGSKTPPTYPSDFENHEEFSKIEKLVDGSATPNLVARLMGLEFMPELSSNDDQKSWNSIFRSKSMDSGNFRDGTEKMQGQTGQVGQHRRVKTSFSFRETQNFFELEGDDFLVLNFDVKSCKKKKKVSNFGESKTAKRRGKQRINREEQRKNRVFTDEERVSLGISPQISQSYKLSPFRDRISVTKTEEDGIKVRKKKMKENCLELSKGEVECELDNSSPVSVLDDSEFISDAEVTVSSNSEDAKSRGSECDSKELSSTSNGSSNLDDTEREKQGNEEQKGGLKRRDYKKHENAEMVRRVCRLAEIDFSNSNWKYRRMFRAEEIDYFGLHFSQLIFDQLINELVDQFFEI